VVFIGLFLPLTLVGYILLRRHTGHRYFHFWLSAASIIFYAWWDYRLPWLIIGSTLVNYAIGKKLNQASTENRRKLLVLGILANLTPLFYYKYSLFLLENFLWITGNHIEFEQLILPLGISFFTFQQIMYIMDAYKGQAPDYKFFHYATFVTFFPQLIAGPIVHHKEMMPQFDSKSFHHLSENIIIGLSIFTIGLFKKIMIADPLAGCASPIYEQANIEEITFFDGWFAALGYTFQLYFDFSGYSDMAIGLARMFGIVLPANFHSPYKARSMIEFWR
jgi:alginate O-acetyltransferase complex protein AlgI